MVYERPQIGAPLHDFCDASTRYGIGSLDELPKTALALQSRGDADREMADISCENNATEDNGEVGGQSTEAKCVVSIESGRGFDVELARYQKE